MSGLRLCNKGNLQSVTIMLINVTTEESLRTQPCFQTPEDGGGDSGGQNVV